MTAPPEGTRLPSVHSASLLLLPASRLGLTWPTLKLQASECPRPCADSQLPSAHRRTHRRASREADAALRPSDRAHSALALGQRPTLPAGRLPPAAAPGQLPHAFPTVARGRALGRCPAETDWGPAEWRPQLVTVETWAPRRAHRESRTPGSPLNGRGRQGLCRPCGGSLRP